MPDSTYVNWFLDNPLVIKTAVANRKCKNCYRVISRGGFYLKSGSKSECISCAIEELKREESYYKDIMKTDRFNRMSKEDKKKVEGYIVSVKQKIERLTRDYQPQILSETLDDSLIRNKRKEEK